MNTTLDGARIADGLGDIQYGRLCEVEFTNFDTGLVSKFNQDFRISFEYNKSIDESSNTSNGTLNIYGMSEDTFNSIGERLRCEVSIRCGYQYSKTNTLGEVAYAALMNKSFEIINGETVSKFELQENFMTLNIGEKLSKTFQSNETLVNVLDNIAKFLNLDGIGIVIPSTKDSVAIGDFIMSIKFPYGYSVLGTPSQELKRICDSYGFTYRIEKKLLVIGLKDHFVQKYLNMITETNKAEAIKTDKADKNKNKIDLLKTNSYYLSYDTGLLGTPKLETVHADVAYDQALKNGEEIVEREVPRIRRYTSGANKGQIMYDKATGKAKYTKKPKYMKIARRQVTVEMLINSAVIPQAMIRLSTNSGILDGLYRVRNMRIAGDTHGSEWSMKLELNM